MKAIISGITGQDGSYLSELLLQKGYEVIGIKRRSSLSNLFRINHIQDSLRLVEGDITDASFLDRLLANEQPDEFYNLAAQSHVGTSFENPYYTWSVTAQGAINCLEAIRHFSPITRFYQASSSEMFGNNVSFSYDVQGRSARYDGKLVKDSIYKNRYGDICISPQHEYDGICQDERTTFAPQSPYAIAKCAAHYATKLYREAYGIHASAGILFNHESSRRGEHFVTRKVTQWIQQNMFPYKGAILKLGNLDAQRDWGYAGDYVKAMWLMLQQNSPDDYVIGTGETHSVKEFVSTAFSCVTEKPYTDFIVQEMALYRPAEVPFLRADYSKAKKILGWEPKVKFNQLVKMMVLNVA